MLGPRREERAKWVGIFNFKEMRQDRGGEGRLLINVIHSTYICICNQFINHYDISLMDDFVIFKRESNSQTHPRRDAGGAMNILYLLYYYYYY